MKGLSHHIQQMLCSICQKNNRIEKMILFGSRATETNRYNSDIDLALYGSELSYSDLTKFTRALDDLWLPYKYDVLILNNKTDEPLRIEIEQYGKVIYELEMKNN